MGRIVIGCSLLKVPELLTAKEPLKNAALLPGRRGKRIFASGRMKNEEEKVHTEARRGPRMRETRQEAVDSGSEQGTACLIEVTQGKEHEESRGVFGQATEADLGVMPEMLDDAEGELDLGPHA